MNDHGYRYTARWKKREEEKEEIDWRGKPRSSELPLQFHLHCFIIAMEDEAEKMIALKRAYADIILNTAKEAAARIMASERRALCFQQELRSTKDESLRMLVRMKQMIDAKAAEAEKTSLNQQRKIEELEAQLNEAEDVITDLRMELKQVWALLEKKNRDVQPLNGESIKQVACFEESAKPEALVSSTNQELQCLTTCGVEKKSLNQIALDGDYCHPTKQTEQSDISSLENDYAQNSDFASIIIRSNEPELCKNGCTQRIRALEGKLMNGKLLARDVHDQHCGINDEFTVRDSNSDVAKFSTPTLGTKKKKTKKHVKHCRKLRGKIFPDYRSCFVSCCKTQTGESCKSDKGAYSLRSIRCAVNKLKRMKRRRGPDYCKSPQVLQQCSSVCDDGERCEEKHDAEMKPVPHLSDAEPVYGSNNVTASVKTVNNFGLVQKAMEKDNEVLDANVLGNLEGNLSQSSTGPSFDMKVEDVDVPSTNTVSENAKAFEEKNDSPYQADDCRLLKYTFQRKRKKESLENPDEETTSEKRTVKRKEEGKQNGVLEPEKCSMIGLTQVAHQLISLPTKS
ncbi:hypothetical protein L6164_005901 [Bauhinia variegata]|uniref:Uncharacterized protein n=1 Tax=Bauhinia variegata TaxID=167791 RepID=A0ACB9PUL4_BAUVA|nr:hypothetical protein L6164_005901 [Bauhinia variegata]